MSKSTTITTIMLTVSITISGEAMVLKADNMPEQTFGVDLEARARADRKRVPIIVTTILTFLDNRTRIISSILLILLLTKYYRLSRFRRRRGSPKHLAGGCAPGCITSSS